MTVSQNACQLSETANIRYQGRKEEEKTKKRQGYWKKKLEEEQREGKEGNTDDYRWTGREKGKRRMSEREGGKNGRKRVREGRMRQDSIRRQGGRKRNMIAKYNTKTVSEIVSSCKTNIESSKN